MSKMYKIVIIVILFTGSLFAQNFIISGKITDASTGESLIGANVYIKALNAGGVSDFYGNYSLSVPGGTYNLTASYVGYTTKAHKVFVDKNVEMNFTLNSTSVELKGLVVEVNRAKERETPITFTEINSDEIQSKYNTQDVPDLIKNVPGVFTNTGGLGEAEIFVRGFDSEQVLILINGVPVNDPESQQVYWSNWTGLSSSASSIQVQRGVGASLVGSGALGGSVNIRTGLYSREKSLRLKSSAGLYMTKGVDGGVLDGKSADGTGGYQSTTPSNQNFYIEYVTGQMMDGKLNLKLSYERKAGDSYLDGTYYNGHAYYIGLQGIFGDHLLTLNAHGAPQRHNQARTSQDINLISKLGREYNRTNHPYQENYYFKPQFELHWDWAISDNQNLNTNIFLTTGSGGGRYLRNDVFDVNSGAISTKNVSDATDRKYLGRNARFIYEKTGINLSGFNGATNEFTYGGLIDTVSKGREAMNSDFAHSWRNDSQNNHVQLGFNTSYSHKLNDVISFVIGGEARLWDAEHLAESFDFRKSDLNGGVKILNQVQNRYNYDGKVTNLSAFGRITLTPIEKLFLTIDGQYASSKQEIIEKPIEIYDYVAERFIGQSYFVSKTSGKFSDDEYIKTFSFITPKFGARYNISDQLTVFANYSIAKKEPKAGDWYNRGKGPLRNDIKEETLTNIEGGIGYRHKYFAVDANYYVADFQDKIESVTTQSDDRETINAGNAEHKGFELAISGRISKFDAGLSVAISDNKWKEMNVNKIFGVDAADVVGKVVPFSPQNMYNASVGYSFIPGLRLGLDVQSWDKYYANYTNTEELPSFLELNLSLSYGFELNNSRVDLRFDAFNLTNAEQYQRAAWRKDYGRNDALNGKYGMYVLQSRLRAFFLTASISI